MKRILAAALVASAWTMPSQVAAQAEPFVGQISYFGFNFCPRGWAQANGQLLSISQNQALFALLGTIYGGDGRTTFALPDLRGRAALNYGQGPDLQNLPIGNHGGVETITLNSQQLPAHNHSLIADEEDATTGEPQGAAIGLSATNIYSGALNAPVQMNPGSISNTGQSAPISKRDPYLAVNTCIALVGVFPPRS